MRLLVRLSGLILLVLAVSSVLDGLHWDAALYATGMVLVLLSLKSRSVAFTKLLASASAVLMLAYFFLFFIETGSLGQPSVGLFGIFLPMVAAFAIMPLVAQLTCRMKAGGCEGYFKPQKRTISA